MPLPAYQRIAADLRARIIAGTYPPGHRLPSLQELEDEFGVGRGVSRPTYQLLISEGLVEGRFGSGYYVREFHRIVRHGRERLAAEARSAGHSIWATDPGTAGRVSKTDAVAVATEPAPDDVAADLGLEAGVLTVVRRRRYVVDDKPVMVSASYFPADLVDGTQIMERETGPGGAYQRLAELGAGPVRFREDVTARMPTVDEATRLVLRQGTPVLEIRRVAWAADQRAVEVNVMLGDAAAYVLRYEFDA